MLSKSSVLRVLKTHDCIVKGYRFTTQSKFLATYYKKPFENIVGKGENSYNQHFVFFPQFFIPIPERISVFKLHLFCRL